MRKVIVCEDEGGRALSNDHDIDLWNALDLLVNILKTSSDLPTEVLEAWKSPRHPVSAREVYAWRAAMEEIKNSELVARCAGRKNDPLYGLMTDKPAMLKISGEITNALMHGYNSRHKITYTQSVSNVPS